jgi:hypothetical protein
VVVILSTITVQGLTEGRFMLWLLYWLSLLVDRGVIHVVVVYIVYHYCLRFYRVVHVVVVILTTITVCQTLNSNGRQYNNHNLNHSSVEP